MSASEGLKATMTTPEGEQRALNALPQIVAVVEALEWASGDNADPDGIGWQEKFFARSDAALAALDEALS